jgi:hypothetical protein
LDLYSKISHSARITTVCYLDGLEELKWDDDISLVIHGIEFRITKKQKIN